MAIPRTSGERPRPRASIPAGEVATQVVAQAITVPVLAGTKRRLVAGEDVETPAATEQAPQRLGS